MKITNIKPILLSAPYGAPNDTELKRFYPLGKRSAAFVIVETDEGVTGLGETYAGVFVPELVVQPVNYLGERLADSDPFEMVAASPLPISGGETFNSAATFRQWMDARAFDIVQPDAAVMGGSGECLETLRAAEAAGIEGVCHAFAAAPCQAANVHAAFAAGSRVIEWAMPPNPLRTELLLEPWNINDGKLRRPTLPGLGIALTEEVMRKYAYVPGTANPGNFT